MDIFLHICFTWSDHIRLLSTKTPKILSLDIVFKDLVSLTAQTL